MTDNFTGLSVFLLQLFAYITGQIPSIGELCPHTRLCTRSQYFGQIIQIKDEASCCSPCSCEEDCNLFGTCCPDKKNVTSPDAGEIIFPCRSQDEIYQRYLARYRYESPVVINVDYRVVDQCSPDAYGNQSLNDAVQGCSQVNMLEDLVFVSDVNDRVYLNKHCALCNGIHEFIAWNLHIPCDELLTAAFASLEEMDRFIIDNCTLYSIPPEQSIGQASVCWKDPIKTCNKTTEWDNIDDEYEELCNKYDMPYTEDYVSIYANIYCFLCNQPPETPYLTICPVPPVPETRLDPPFFSWMAPFTAIIAFDEDANRITPGKSPVCPREDVFSPITKTCVKLVCPNGYVASFGSCESPFDVNLDRCLEVRLGVKVTEVVGTPMTLKDYATIGIPVNMAFMKSITAYKMVCTVSSILSFKLANGDVMVEIKLQTNNKTCSHLKLLEALGVVVGRHYLEIEMNGRKLIVPPYLVETEVVEPVLKHVSFWPDYEENEILAYCTPFNNYDVYCPAIDFHFNETVKLTDTSLINAISKSAYRISENELRICTKYLTVATDDRASVAPRNTRMSLWMMTYVLVAVVHVAFD